MDTNHGRRSFLTLALMLCCAIAPQDPEPKDKSRSGSAGTTKREQSGGTRSRQAGPKRPTYCVVVNSNNRFSASTKDKLRTQLKQLFLKKDTSWPDGTKCRPYARDASTAVQKAFVKDVLRMTDAELARHWLAMKNRSGERAPKTLRSARLVQRFVAKYDGAFGLLEKSEATGLRILLEF